MMQVCPYCKSEIPDDAIKCKFCWEYIDSKLNDRTKKIPTKLKYKWFQRAPKIFCPHCNYEGKAEFKKGWSGCISFILWMCFIIPWIIYSIRRSSKEFWICPKCWNDKLIEENN